MTNIKFIFALFDGDGGEGSSESSASLGSLGNDARDFLRSLGEPEESFSESHQQIVNEDDSTDADAVEHNGDAQETNEPEGGETFADLIAKGGKYHDEYGKAVSQAIKDRFKNQADYKSTIDGYEDAVSPLFAKYGLEPGDIEGLKSSIATDDGNFADAAQKAGLSIEQYKDNLKLQREAEEGRQIKQAYEREKARNEVYAQWESEADSLKESFPNFDLLSEIKGNSEFADLLDNGVSVMNAFFATHAADIMAGMNAESNNDAKKSVVNEFKQRASRPPENAAKHNPASQRRFDPSQLSDDDLDKILKDIENGGSVSF